MLNRYAIGVVALTAGLLAMGPAAWSQDASKYPDFKGQWVRVGNPNWIRPGAPPPPLTPEYQAVFEASKAAMREGFPGNVPSWQCLPNGMPMMMNLYKPTEIVVTPEITYILTSNVGDAFRRIYTDGRDWPAEGEYQLTYAGYSIGKWVDTDGDGRYDVLEIETRNMKLPRTYDGNGVPFHKDGKAVVKERIYLDKADKNTLLTETTVIDNALREPWTQNRKAVRNMKPRPLWETDVCPEDNSMVKIGDDAYYTSADGKLMPLTKNQQPPDLRYFNQTQNQKKK